MKIIKLFTFAIASLTIVSCTNDEIVLQENNHRAPDNYNSLKITPDEAVQYADQIVNEFSNQKTRSPRTLKSIMMLKSERTRSGDTQIPDSMLYLVNYADERGFVLVAADRRLRPFYAVSDEGNLDLSDTLENKGLAMAMNGIYADVNSGLFPFDTAYINPGSGWGTGGRLPDTPIGSGYDCVEKVASMLEPLVKKWGQDYPFNSLTPLINGVKTKAGCTAIACAQIMSHYEWPTSYQIGNYSARYNWNVIKFYPYSSDLSHLLFDLGRPENLNIDYGIYESGAILTSRDNITFQNMGYSTYGGFNDFNAYNMAKELKKSRPLLTIGKGVNPNVAHAWVIDGYALYKYTFELSPLYGATCPYFHCVWGWEGKSNGYFSITNGISGKPYDKEFDEGDRDEDIGYKFTENLRYKSYFEPIK